VAHFADDIPNPAAVFAPYFYVEPFEGREWLDLNIRLMNAAAGLKLPVPVHGVLCVDQSILEEKDAMDWIAQELPKTGIAGIWLWISRLTEDELIGDGHPDVKSTHSYARLSALRSLTERLSDNLAVYNMHGGFFSLALSKYGMSGISHGVGYGEQKDVVPVIGQAIPVVRYYLPELHRRLGVPDIERCFPSLRIDDPDDFYEQICDCTICKGVVVDNVSQFRLFGEMQPPKPGKTKSTQTPAAAKRCRFHFLLSRIHERDWIKKAGRSEIAESLRAANSKWSKHATVRRYCAHLEVWESVLKNT